MSFKKFALMAVPFLLSFSPLSSAEEEIPVVILGGGIAGLTAAIQTTQAGVQPLVITGPNPGGIILKSHSIRNWPGEIDITGSELMDKLQKQAETANVAFYQGEAIHIDVEKKPFLITLQNPLDKSTRTIKARTCIIALGAVPRLLNVPGEQENLFSTLFTCAPCDGLRFKNQTVAVIGGGDGALIEAQYLSNLAKKVYVIVRSDKFKTIQPKYMEAVLARSNIEVIYMTTVQKFKKQEDGLSLELRSTKGIQELPVQGAFLAIGSIPNTSLFQGKLELDKEGYVVLKKGQQTSVEGIFAAGDVSDKIVRQATFAAGAATAAALQAQQQFDEKPSTASLSPPTAAFKELSSLKMLRDVLSSTKKPVVVYFYADWCGPCRFFKPTYTQWTSQYQDKAVFVKVNADKAPDCFREYQVRGFPSVLILNSQGKVIHQATGLDELAKLPTVFEK